MPRIELGGGRRKRVSTTAKKAAQKIYQDKRWKLVREEKLRNNPACENCEREGRTSLSVEIHHIIPFSQGSTPEMVERLAFDYDNLEALCSDCHRNKHLNSTK